MHVFHLASLHAFARWLISSVMLMNCEELTDWGCCAVRTQHCSVLLGNLAHMTEICYSPGYKPDESKCSNFAQGSERVLINSYNPFSYSTQILDHDCAFYCTYTQIERSSSRCLWILDSDKIITATLLIDPTLKVTCRVHSTALKKRFFSPSPPFLCLYLSVPWMYRPERCMTII